MIEKSTDFEKLSVDLLWRRFFSLFKKHRLQQKIDGLNKYKKKTTDFQSKNFGSHIRRLEKFQFLKIDGRKISRFFEIPKQAVHTKAGSPYQSYARRDVFLKLTLPKATARRYQSYRP